MQLLPSALHCVDFQLSKTVVLPVYKHFEALSVQLSLTACCLDPSVLNLWDYSRRPRVLYPVAGLPCRNGIHTHWIK